MTALHYASSCGLQQCVQLLIRHGANISAENGAGETACDIAERCGYERVAQYLEAYLLFNEGTGAHAAAKVDEASEEDLFPVTERFAGLSEQELIEAKDLLLVETSDMLQVPLFTAEALLRNHGRSSIFTQKELQNGRATRCGRCGNGTPSPAANGRACVRRSRHWMRPSTRWNSPNRHSSRRRRRAPIRAVARAD